LKIEIKGKQAGEGISFEDLRGEGGLNFRITVTTGVGNHKQEVSVVIPKDEIKRVAKAV